MVSGTGIPTEQGFHLLGITLHRVEHITPVNGIKHPVPTHVVGDARDCPSRVEIGMPPDGQLMRLLKMSPGFRLGIQV